jgi:phage gp29-like protein
MKPISLQTETTNMLEREFQVHHPMSGVKEVLDLLRQAEFGVLTAQAELFSDMEERDAHIFAEMQKRRMAVSKLDWALVPSGDAGARERKAAGDLGKLVADMVDMSTIIFDMGDSIGHGYGCQEIEWAKDGTLWLPKKLHPRPQRWFTVDKATRLNIRLRVPDNSDGMELQKFGWLVHEHSSKTGYPATNGIFRVLALPYLFKNFAVRNWLRFCELYGVPMRALFHTEKDEPRRRELLAALQALGASGAALFDGASGEDLRTIPLTAGEGQGFEALVTWAEKSMSKAILGGTLTSQADGATSTNALGKVHDDSRMLIRDHDAKQMAATLTTQLFGAIIQVNGLSMRLPKFVFDIEEGEDLAVYADALPKLVGAGMIIPEKWAHDKLKIPQAEAGEAVLKVAQAQASPPATTQPGQPTGLGAGHVCLAAGDGAKFTPQQMAIEKLADEMLANMKSPIDAAAIKSAVLAAKSPEDLEARLAVVLEKADTSKFQEQLERALWAADIMGYAHAGGR